MVRVVGGLTHLKSNTTSRVLVKKMMAIRMTHLLIRRNQAA
jgi:hypothetical protein